MVDTLIGRWLPAYRPRAKVKEVAQPKFYWFDSGVRFSFGSWPRVETMGLGGNLATMALAGSKPGNT